MNNMEMKPFRHTVTGNVDYFPDTEYFRNCDYLELIGTDEDLCVDCGLTPAFLEPLNVEDDDTYDEEEDED